MAISRDLFLSILALDSYNRGYNAGLSTLSDSVGTKIGDATIVDRKGDTNAQSYGFYAVAYSWNGETVISYRGTDFSPASELAKDVTYGWSGALGNFSTYASQIPLAVSFYESVTEQSVYSSNSNVVMTGHSLGGGLGGMIAALGGNSAVVFDHMPFGPLASLKAAYDSLVGVVGAHQPTVDNVTGYNANGEVLVAARSGQLQDAFAKLLGKSAITAAFGTFLSSISSSTRQWESQITKQGVDSYDFQTLQNAVSLHSQNLLVLLQFSAEQTGSFSAKPDWASVSKPFINALFDVKVGKALGFKQDGGGSTGKADEAGQMRTVLAYSAIDEGVRVYGDTGIRALFNDANELGQTLKVSDASKSLKDAAESVSKILVQYAGQLAKGQVLKADHSEAVDGVLNVTSAQNAVETISINFGETAWKLGASGGQATTDVIGRTELTDKALAASDGGNKSDVRGAMKWLWNDDKSENIDQVTFAATNKALTKTIADREGGASNKVALFVAGGGDDTITGSAHNDFIYGGDGKDTLRGGAGDDLVMGGKGDDYLAGDGGKNYLMGGDGADTLITGTGNDGDKLDGGAGFDIYVVKAYDTVIDSDRKGRLTTDLTSGLSLVGGRERSKNSGVFFDDAGDAYRVVGTGLEITLKQGGVVTITSWSVSGDLSIRLLKFEEPDTKNDYDPPKERRVDPLILDLNGDGISLTSLNGSNTYFDLKGSGFAGRTAWVAPTDGLLAIDKNGNGQIDDINELFGNAGQDGFSKLATLDANHDGVVNALDPGFADLRVWQDANGDGITDAGELHTLAELGIASIGATGTPTNGLTVADNSVTELGVFTRTDGTTGTVGEVLFNTNLVDTKWVRPPGYTTTGLADALPFIRGHGLVADSDVAFTNDGALALAFKQFLVDYAGHPLAEARSHFETLMLQWAGADTVGTTSRGQFINAQHLVFLEKIYNSEYKWYSNRTGLLITDAPTAGDGRDLEAKYQKWLDATFFIVISQATTSLDKLGVEQAATSHNPWIGFSALTYDHDADKVTGDLGASLVLAMQHQPTDPKLALDYWVQFINDFRYAAHDLGDGHIEPIYYQLLSNLDQIKNVAVRSYVETFLNQALTSSANYDHAGTSASEVYDGGANPWGAGRVIWAKAGDDILSRTEANETVLYFAGDGDDVIETGFAVTPNRKLAFPDLKSTDVEFHRLGDDLIINIKLTGAVIKIIGGVNPERGNDDGHGFDSIAFTDHRYYAYEIRDLLQATDLTADVNETVYGTNSDDTVQWSPGDDVFNGTESTSSSIDSGHDTFTFGIGAGHDVIAGEYGPSTYFTGGGTVQFDARIALSDIEFHRVGYDLIVRIKGTDDTLTIKDQFPSGAIQSFVFTADDGTQTTFSFADLVAQIRADNAGNDIIDRSASGHDVLSNAEYIDPDNGLGSTFVGGHGNDTMVGTGKNDVFVINAGDGRDVITERPSETNVTSGVQVANNEIKFGAGINPNNVTVHLVGLDLIFTFAGTNDRATFGGDVTKNTAFAGSYVAGAPIELERVSFADGTVWDHATLLANAQSASTVQATQTGFLGGVGPTFAADYSLGSSYARLPLFDPVSGNSISNVTLNLHGVSPADLDLQLLSPSNWGGSLLLSTKGSTAAGLVIGSVGESDPATNWLVKIVFDDGTVWDHSQLLARMVASQETSGNDIVYGFNPTSAYEPGIGNDTLVGGSGDDVLIGGLGADTYVYSRGDGFDVIDDRGARLSNTTGLPSTDKVVFTDIRSDEVTFTRVGNSFDAQDLIINIPGKNGVAGGSIIIKAQFTTGQDNTFTNFSANTIERFEFSDGVVLTSHDIELRVLAAATTSGDDLIVGFAGDDTLVGGKGDDILIGGPGSDTYVWNAGDGHDIIRETGNAAPSQYDAHPSSDRLLIHGVTPGQVTVGTAVGDAHSIELIVGGNRQNSITIENSYQTDGVGNGVVEDVIFDDGTDWHITDLVLMIQGGIPTALTITGTAGNDDLTGTDGRDVFSATLGDDILRGGAGSDVYYYGIGSGNDTIIENVGNGANFEWTDVNVVIFQGLNKSDVTFGYGADGAQFFEINATHERLNLPLLQLGGSVEQFYFADASRYLLRDVLALEKHAIGTSAGEALAGTGIVEGRGGDDTLSGDVNTTYLWRAGDGNDTTINSNYTHANGVLKLQGVAVSDVTVTSFPTTGFYSDLLVRIASTGEVITVKHQASGGLSGIVFDDGTYWTAAQVLNLAGTSSADTITGTIGNDVIFGSAGNDVFDGGAGSDTYIWKSGDGNDLIKASADAALDTLVLTDVVRSGVTVTARVDANNGNQLLLDVHIAATGETITVEGDQTGAFGVRTIKFADGTTLDTHTGIALPELAPVAVDDTGYSVSPGQSIIIDPQTFLLNDFDANGDPLTLVSVTAIDGGTVETLPDGTIRFTPDSGYTGTAHIAYVVSDGTLQSQGTAFVEVRAVPTEGPDVLTGTDGNDVINALGGDDTVYAGAGVDIITGGKGNDTLYGGPGSDTYVYNRGDGNDTIFEFGGFLGGSDVNKLVLTGYQTSEVTVRLVTPESGFGSDLVVSFPGDGQSILVKSFTSAFGSAGGVQQIVFQDGTVWDRAAILAHLSTIITVSTPAISGISPDTGAGSTDGLTNVDHVSINGTADAGSFINVYDGGTLIGTATADMSGYWSLVNVALTEGSNALTATATSGGTTSPASTVFTATLDTVAPNQAVIGGISPDTGSNAADGITNASVVTISGSAEANSLVKVYDGGLLVGTTTADATGAWTLTGVTLTEGANALTATATDAASNVSLTSATTTVTLDTVAPNQAIIGSISSDSGFSATDGITNVGVVNVTGTAEANSTVAIYDNGTLVGTTQADGSGAWTLVGVTLAQGANALTATANDAAGNVGIASTAYTATLDTTAPTVTMTLASDTGVSATDGITTNAALKGTAEAGSQVSIFDGSTLLATFKVAANGTWTYTPSGLADGAHAFSAVATDTAGNSSMASVNVLLDTQGPTGWTFVLGTAAFDDTASVAAGTGLGTILATGDTNSAEFRYFFATDASGAGATQTRNGLSIDAVTGVVTTTQALTTGSTTWVIAQDLAGHTTAKPLVISVGTSAANTMAIAAGTTLTVGLGGNDTITGTSGADVIAAGSGNDTINGFVGADTVDGGSGTDTIVLTATSADLNTATDAQIVKVEAISAATATAGVTINLSNQSDRFTTTGSSFNDVLTGGSGADIINAGAGDDTVNGFVGADTVNGGAGFDTLALTGTSADLNAATNAQLVAVEAITAASATSGVTLDLRAQSDGFVLTGSAFADTITSSSGVDTINAGAGDDIIINFIGADSIDGGAGLNTLLLTATSATLNVAADAQVKNIQVVSAATATAGVTVDLHKQAEGFTIIGSAYGDKITGGVGTDTITTGDGVDTIYSFVGADSINGGLGIDTLVLTATSADLNAASDAQLVNIEVVSASTAVSGVTIDLHNQTDGFTLTGSAFNDVLTGSAGADIINTGTGDDIILGFTGADTVNGGTGFDTIVLTGTSADLNAATNAQIGTVEAITAASATSGVTLDLRNQTDGFTLTGSAFNDVLTGSSAADIINGGAGDDIIVNFVGADIIDGGAGLNTLMFTATSSTLAAATDAQLTNVQIITAATAAAGVTIDLRNQTEGFTIIGSAFGDKIIGSAGADTITMSDGNDTVIGFVGADTVNGGLGTDTLALSATSADLNAASDSQLTSIEAVTAVTATAGVTIDLRNQSDGFTLTGSAFNDVLTGSSGIDIINGGAGDDIIINFVGADTVNGGTGFDTIMLTGTSTSLNTASNAQIAAVEAVSAAGATSGVTIDLHNQTEAFVITGGAFNDVLIGTAAADTLNAGGGSNTMTGGKGADTFVFNADFVSGVITDFAAGAAVGHDTLDIVFPGIDWNSLIASNAMHQVGADTVIDLGAHGSITLKNVAKTALVVDDFKFV